MKVKDIVNGVTAIKKLGDMDMPIGIAMKIKNNIDKFQAILETLEERRLSISKELEEGEDFTPDMVKQLEVYFEEELDLEINIINLSTLEENNIKLSPSDLTNIIWMVDLDA